MELYLIRHTITECKNTCYGQSDVNIENVGDIKDVVEKFRILNLPDNTNFYSSPLLRCKKLVQALTDDFKIDNRLMEMNFGEWELMKWEDIDRNELDKWSENFVYEKCPNGECFFDLSERVRSFFNQIKNQKTAVVVTHAGVIRVLLCIMLGLDLKNAFRINLDYGGISKITFKDEITAVDFINR